MAVQVFKDGQSTYVDAKRLKNHLSAGWSLTPDGVEAEGSTTHDEDTKMLESMGILPTIDNVVIGAMHVRV